MQNEKREMKPNEPNHPALIPAMRWMANMICLWGLCAKPACRRAQRCKRDPRDCLARYAPLVPEDAREGVKAMLEGRSLGLSYDEVREDAPAEVAAVEDWIARVDRSRRNSLPSPAARHRRHAGNAGEYRAGGAQPQRPVPGAGADEVRQ